MDPIEYVTTSLEYVPLWEEVRRRLGDGKHHIALLKREFVRALSVKALDSPGGMPAELDAVWHEVVLNTRYYASLCQRVRGEFVHHSTESEADSDIARRSRIDATVLNYRKRYREEPAEAVWGDDDDAEPEAPFSHLFVRQMNGKTTSCTALTPATTIMKIKEMLQKKTGIPVDEQRLIFAGRQLEDKLTCAHYNLQNDCRLHMVQRMRGC
jgi:hypothetical protein